MLEKDKNIFVPPKISGLKAGMVTKNFKIFIFNFFVLLIYKFLVFLEICLKYQYKYYHLK